MRRVRMLGLLIVLVVLALLWIGASLLLGVVIVDVIMRWWM